MRCGFDRRIHAVPAPARRSVPEYERRGRTHSHRRVSGIWTRIHIFHIEYHNHRLFPERGEGTAGYYFRTASRSRFPAAVFRTSACCGRHCRHLAGNARLGDSDVECDSNNFSDKKQAFKKIRHTSRNRLFIFFVFRKKNTTFAPENNRGACT